jgi:hypothetical protein
MDAHDVRLLATYNAERARGLVHQERWADQMALLQARFDREQRDLQMEWLRGTQGIGDRRSALRAADELSDLRASIGRHPCGSVVGVEQAPPGSDAAVAYDDRARTLLTEILQYDPRDENVGDLLSQAYQEILRLSTIARQWESSR